MKSDILIKDLTDSNSEIKVIQNGDFVITQNKAKHVIHKIDLSHIDSGILAHRWIGYRSDEQFKEITDGHFFDLFKKNKCTKILVDISDMTSSFHNVNDWMATYLMPKLVKAGLTHSAVILSKNVFTQLSAAQWEEKSSGFTNRNFQNVEKALAWLKEQ
jgi:hypothetical protein